MSIQYYVKAIYAGAVAALSAVSGALIAIDGGFGDLTAGLWVAAAVAGLAAFGGVLGWQEAPKSVSTSIR